MQRYLLGLTVIMLSWGVSSAWADKTETRKKGDNMVLDCVEKTQEVMEENNLRVCLTDAAIDAASDSQGKGWLPGESQPTLLPPPGSGGTSGGSASKRCPKVEPNYAACTGYNIYNAQDCEDCFEGFCEMTVYPQVFALFFTQSASGGVDFIMTTDPSTGGQVEYITTWDEFTRTSYKGRPIAFVNDDARECGHLWSAQRWVLLWVRDYCSDLNAIPGHAHAACAP